MVHFNGPPSILYEVARCAACGVRRAACGVRRAACGVRDRSADYRRRVHRPPRGSRLQQDNIWCTQDAAEFLFPSSRLASSPDDGGYFGPT